MIHKPSTQLEADLAAKDVLILRAAIVTATCAGGPTTNGASAQSYIDIQCANSSSGTTLVSAAFFDHSFYVI